MSLTLSVVIASHHRPLRLRWLLNALERQTLERSQWEAVVCFHEPDTATGALLGEHPLALAGTLRSVSDARASVGAKRNVALEHARAATIVFTDDDCRPPERWLEHVLDAARRHPGAIVQGAIDGDPDEWVMRRAPRPMTQSFNRVPRPWAECANIVYPREAVLAAGGFAEHMRGGEDADLNLRVQANGVSYVGEEKMLTYHAITDASLLEWIRASMRWQDLPELFKRHPQLRAELFLDLFWKREHFWLLVALLGAAGTRRDPWRALTLLPWAVGRGTHQDTLRGRVRDLLELPGWAVVDAAELLALARGSIRHRTLVL